MKKPALYSLLGIVLIVVGLYAAGVFGGGVSAADQARCEQTIQEIYGDNPQAKENLTPKCSEAGMVSMMDAKSRGLGAAEAAANIGNTNQNNIISLIIGCALLGAGIGAIGAAFGARKRNQ